jgi:hypothetical protein
MRTATQIQQISSREWMFEWYGRIYTYFTSKDFNFTQVYSCNSKGEWIKPYVCLTRNEYMPITATNEHEVAKQLEQFMCSGDNEVAKSLGGHYSAMYNYQQDDDKEYRSGDLQRMLPSRFKKPNAR